MREAGHLLKAAPGDLAAKIASMREQNKALSRNVQALQDKAMSESGKNLMAEVKQIGGVNLLARQVDAPDMDALRRLMDDLRSKMPSGVIALAAEVDGKALLVLSVSKDLHKHCTAPALMRNISEEIGGGGGGRPDLAQAGGNRPKGIQAALARLEVLLG